MMPKVLQPFIPLKVRVFDFALARGFIGNSVSL